jgi:hypothetical protein
MRAQAAPEEKGRRVEELLAALISLCNGASAGKSLGASASLHLPFTVVVDIRLDILRQIQQALIPPILQTPYFVGVCCLPIRKAQNSHEGVPVLTVTQQFS